MSTVIPEDLTFKLLFQQELLLGKLLRYQVKQRNLMWHVYILEAKDNRLYTGITNDLDHRMEMHKIGKGARFTRSFGFKKLRYFEDFSNRSEALKREAEIKSWPKKEKITLIKGKLMEGARKGV